MEGELRSRRPRKVLISNRKGRERKPLLILELSSGNTISFCAFRLVYSLKTVLWIDKNFALKEN